jgi:hypothetical protein
MKPPVAGSYYRHQDGGYYLVLNTARSSEDQSEQVVYLHIWPFDLGVWVRPMKEWASRFSQVPESECALALAGDRATAQERVISAKAARRARQA